MAEKRVKRTTTSTVAPRKVTAATAADSQNANVTADQIAAKAYALYVQRGFENGHDVEDWIEAERQLSRS